MPTRQDIPTFIRSTFRSVWALELLCYLKRHADRSASHQEIVTELRGSDLVVTQSLAALSAAGLVLGDEEGAARYSPASEGLDQLTAAAEVLYRKSPDAVRRMIVSALNPGLAAFSDAFNLRTD